jgi:Domain of unknown function (DUF6916)
MELTRALFERYVHTKFWLVAANGERSALDLIQFRDGHSSPRNEQFALLFRGDENTIHPQQTYKVEHDAIGPFDLFLVPIARDAEGTLYEAVFHRFTEDSDST